MTRSARAKPETTLRVRDGHVLSVDEATSARMAAIRQQGTRPELVVRKLLTRLGLGYRLANRDLPGSPDLANRKRRWALFVHGCFWHRHGCRATSTPTRNRAFWEAKFARNVARDEAQVNRLRSRGYRVVIVWECETRSHEPGLTALAARLQRELSTDPGSPDPGRPGARGPQLMQHDPGRDGEVE